MTDPGSGAASPVPQWRGDLESLAEKGFTAAIDPRRSAGVIVVACRGRLDVGAVPVCAAALVRVLEKRPRWVIVDLGQAEIVRQSTAVLALMRRGAARRGVRLGLSGVSEDGLRILCEAKVAALYMIQPTVGLALAAVTGPSLLSSWSAQSDEQYPPASPFEARGG